VTSSLNSVNQFMYVMVKCSVFFEVRTEFLNSNRERAVVPCLSLWFCMCHIVCHPVGHVSLHIIENLFPNTESSPRFEPRIVFGFVTLISLISSPK
jgi:hypothetical protein